MHTSATKGDSAIGEAQDVFLAFADSRARNLPTRLIAASAVLLMNVSVLGIWLMLSWLGLYAAVQLVEQPILRGLSRWRRVSFRLRETAMLALLSASSVLFAAIAVPFWLSPGWAGPATAGLVLAGAASNAAVVGRGMKKVFYVCFIPYSALMFVGPFLMRYVSAAHDQPTSYLPLIVGASLISINIITAYLSAEKIRRAEADARRELDGKRIQAQAATEAKSAFVSAVSHELRTPLTAIMASASAIQRGAASPEEADRASMITEAVMMMRTLLDDLLDLSKIEAGRMGVEVIAFDIRHVIEDVARFWSEEAGRKGLRLSVVGAEALPAAVGGDPTRIRQVLNNLLSNAVKFTATGGIAIEALCALQADGGVRLQVSVTDTGPGMTANQMQRLFTRFDQTDGAVARTHGGTGLGLAISRELARLMGGDLSAESAPGRGARFVMSCLLQPAAAPACLGPEPADEAMVAGDLRCLVVDDHDLNRRALTLLLEPLGVVPVLACGGEEALAILAEQAFDLVLMDLNMAGLDGRETTRRLRTTQGPNRGVPVVAVTGAAEAETLQSCLAAGMDAWVEKPLQPQALYAAIERVLAEGQHGSRSVAA